MQFYWKNRTVPGQRLPTGKERNSPLMTDNDQISELAEKARTGNRESMDRLISLFYQDIFRMVYYRTHSRMDAEDLTQEIFMQMIRGLPGLKDTARLRPWLFRIALNRVRDFYRKKSMLVFFGLTPEIGNCDEMDGNMSDNPAEYMKRKEFWHQFRKFADRLSKWEREIFLLRFADHMGIREIAETLKKNESTVKTHLYRGLKKFRQASGFRELLND